MTDKKQRSVEEIKEIMDRSDAKTDQVRLRCGDAKTTPAIYGALSAVMSELSAIGKDSENKGQGFKFRGIDAVYNELHPLMAKHKIFTVPRVIDLLARKERESRNGGVLAFTLLKIEYDFVSGVDGSKITVGPIIGEGMDSGDKGTNKAMAIAHKYALFQLFLIPTEKSDDPDAETHNVRPIRKAAPAPVKPAPVKPVNMPTVEVPTAAADSLTIETVADAEGIAKQLMDLAKMHTTVDSLRDFWNKNERPIKALRTNFTEQYVELENHFKTLSTNAQQGA